MKSPTSEVTVAAPDTQPQRPLLIRFTSIEQWLCAWVDYRRLTRRDPSGLSYYDQNIGKQSVPLIGSIGLDTAITRDGEVWILHGIGDDELDGWRPAWPNERTAVLISSQRHWPELAVLLPTRPPEAIDCSDCAGTGLLFGAAWCHACSERGWVVAGLDTRLE